LRYPIKTDSVKIRHSCNWVSFSFATVHKTVLLR